MQTAKVYIHRNPEKLWEAGVIMIIDGEKSYVKKHECATWDEIGAWVTLNYVH